MPFDIGGENTTGDIYWVFMTDYKRDHYFLKAKKEGYLSRAVYKLIEVDKKHKLLRPGMRVLDLGAAPGSWTQWASRRVGRNGCVVSVDIQEIVYRFPENVSIIKGDLTDPDFVQELIDRFSPFDIVLSDMAPFTTGNKTTDSIRSAMLAEQALFVALRVLKSEGYFLVKIFQGPDFQDFLSSMRKSFIKVKVIKPQASKKHSKETYLLGIGLKT